MVQKTLDVSAMSLHKVLQVASESDAINEWGSVVALTYIAAQKFSLIIMIWLMLNRYWNQ